MTFSVKSSQMVKLVLELINILSFRSAFLFVSHGHEFLFLYGEVKIFHLGSPVTVLYIGPVTVLYTGPVTVLYTGLVKVLYAGLPLVCFEF